MLVKNMMMREATTVGPDFPLATAARLMRDGEVGCLLVIEDFLAAVAGEEGRGGTVLVASGDRDAFQLASDKTTILQPVRAGEMARIGPAEVLERYGVEPGQVPDFIALRGDPRTSCRVPRVSGRSVRRSCAGGRPAALSPDRDNGRRGTAASVA